MLYGWFYQEILRFLYSLTRNRPQAEDLTQDTFMRAMAHAHQLSAMEKPACKAWLYRTAKNLFLDSVRKQKREQELIAPTLTYQQDFSGLLVEQVLSGLTKEDQQLFRMRYLEGFNANQVAKRCGLPPATVRTRLARARQLLKSMMDNQEGEPTS
jgi:RNA polymerase sigma-70 factor (ECF subfamily)